MPADEAKDKNNFGRATYSFLCRVHWLHCQETTEFKDRFQELVVGDSKRFLAAGLPRCSHVKPGVPFRPTEGRPQTKTGRWPQKKKQQRV